MKKRRPLGSTFVLKINLQCCKACPMIIKKKLQKISGVNSFTIDVEKGRIEVNGEVDPSTIVKELSTLGKEPELTSFIKNKPPQHVKINYKNKSIKDDDSSESDSDSDDHGEHVKGRSHNHVSIGPRRPNVIIPPMHHQHRPHHYNMNARGNGYFQAGPPPPEYQNMRMPYAGNGYRDRHYFQPPYDSSPPPGYDYHQHRPHHYNMNARGNGYFQAGPPPPEYQNMRMPYAGNGYRDRHYFQPPYDSSPPPPPPGYDYHQPIVPPPNEYYKFLGYNYMSGEAPVGNSSWQFFSDDNHETYCTVM